MEKDLSTLLPLNQIINQFIISEPSDFSYSAKACKRADKEKFTS